MVSEEKLKWEQRIWSFLPLKIFLYIILKVKKEKWKTKFYCRKENFIRSGYCKLLLSQGYILFEVNINLYVSVFHLLPDSST